MSNSDTEADLYSSIHWEQQTSNSTEQVDDPLSQSNNTVQKVIPITTNTTTTKHPANPTNPNSPTPQHDQDIYKNSPTSAKNNKEAGVSVHSPEKIGDGVRDAYIAYTVQVSDNVTVMNHMIAQED
jgi:hypothetical protein